MRMTESIDKLAGALAKAQGALEDAQKDAENPHFRSKYADLAAIREAIKRPLSENGLSYVQLVRLGDKCVEVETLLMHESGQYLGETLAIPLTQHTPQAVGSATSYGRRYSLMSLIGVAASADDDDGEAAMGRDERPRPQAVPQRRGAPAEQSSSQRMADQMIRALAGRPTVRHVDAFFAKDEVMRDYGLLDDEDKARVDAAAAARRAEIESGGATLMAGA